MFHQDIIHLQRRDFLSSPIDYLFQAASDFQIAICIEIALIAGSEPAIGKAAGIGGIIIFIARRNIFPANRDLALVSLWLDSAFSIQDTCLLYTSPSPRD